MTNDGNIYITISDTRGGGSTSGVPSTPDTQDKKDKSNDYVTHLFYNFLKSKAKEALNNGISNIGNFTGHYQTQREVQAAVSALSKLSGLAIGAIAGFKVGGPIGAAAGFAVSVASTIISDVSAGISYTQQIKNQNQEIEQLRTRSGLNPLNNGGRTG